MRSWLCVVALSVMGFPQVAMAQSSTATFAPPIKYRQSQESVILDGKGGALRKLHIEMTILTQAGVSAGQAQLPYSGKLGEVTVTNAHTLKPDGRKIPVPPSAILTQAAPGSASARMFSDVMMKVVIFPDVAVGDTLVLDYEERSTGLFPGYSSGTRLYRTDVPLDESVFSVSAPSDAFVQAEAVGTKMVKTSQDGRTVYTVRFSNANAVRDTNPLLAPWDRMPRMAFSTFRSYDEMAKAYAGLAEPGLAVTPALQALADELTKGITDRRLQARAIYNHVASKIRYVAIAFGTGAIVPHTAAEVLTNGYGDCKDKAVLLTALLKAKGIDSNLVIINALNTYSVSEVPAHNQFNHVIAWLPEFNMYADATGGSAPFGTLPLPLHGKTAIHVGAKDGPARRTVPLAPATQSISLKTDAVMDEAGKITGTTTVQATGAMDVMLRGIAQLLQARGAQGTYPALHPVFETGKPEALDEDLVLKGTFSMDANPRLLTGDGFVPPVGPWFVARPGGHLMGSVSQNGLTEKDDTPCHSGQARETIRLTLPAGRKVTKLPGDTAIKGELGEYSARWSQSGQVVTVERSFVSKVDQAVCRGPSRKAAMSLLAGIEQDYKAQLMLAAQ